MRAAGQGPGGTGSADDDRARFDEALDFVTAGRGAGTLRRLAYPVYVTILIGLTYGFTFTRSVFVTSDPQWVSAHLLNPTAGGVFALLLALAVAFVHRSCRRSGAVVPPVAWTDQVLTSSIDRALALRPWWHLTLAAATTAGALLGVLLGGSLWASAVTGPLALPVAGLVGGGVGALLAHVALWGQAQRRRPVRPAQALRMLPIEELRTQAAAGEHLIGALLAGDVRGGQLELAAPIRRGRALQLRPGRPVGAVVRRDALGLRRDPFTWVRGGVLAVLGGAATAWACLEPGAPPILSALGLVLLHFGTTSHGEGLRMNADHAGSPALFGLGRPSAALAHTILPAGLTFAAWVVVAALLAVAAGATTLEAAVALAVAGLAVTLTTAATAWMATFRPPPGLALLMPGAGPQLLVLRLVTPAALAFLVGVLLPQAARGEPVDLARAAVAVAVTGMWGALRGRSALRRTPDEV